MFLCKVALRVKVTTSPDTYEFIYPTKRMQWIELDGIHPDDFMVAEDQFLIDGSIRKTYIDPRRYKD